MSDRHETSPEHVEPRDAREALALDEPLLLLLTAAVEHDGDPFVDDERHRAFVEATVRYVRAVEEYAAQPQLRTRFHDRLNRLYNVLGQYVVAQALQPPSGPRSPEATAIVQIASRVREFALAHERQRLAQELPAATPAIRERFGIDPDSWREG